MTTHHLPERFVRPQIHPHHVPSPYAGLNRFSAEDKEFVEALLGDLIEVQGCREVDAKLLNGVALDLLASVGVRTFDDLQAWPGFPSSHELIAMDPSGDDGLNVFRWMAALVAGRG